MKKKNGLLWGVAALVALCIVYIVVGQYMDHPEKKEQEKKEAERIFVTDIGEVAGIAYDYEGDELSFSKKEDTWSYDGDELFPVEESRLTSIESTVSKLEAVRKLEGGDDVSAYGLEEPVRTVTVTASDGTKTVLSLGGVTDDGDYYVMAEGQETPYLISSTLYTETSYGLDQLMALEKFPSVDGTDIREITITKDGNSEHYIKKKADTASASEAASADSGSESIVWYKGSADSEENILEDNSSLNVLADSLSTLTVKSCVNYKVTEEELAGYGLENPSIEIRYVYDDNGAEKTLVLSVGNLSGDGTSYYTRMDDSVRINEIDQASIDKCLTVDAGVKEAS